MKVLITGGAGYIGSHCNRCFAVHDVDTVVLDDLSDGHAESVVAGRFINGDFGNNELISTLLRTERFDAVLHFAAFASVPDSVARPSHYYENNVSKLRVLLDAVVENGIKYFVFSSSAATFGEPSAIPVDESHPQNPINPYGTTKLIGEQMLKDYEAAYGLRYCAFRYFNAAGASSDSVIGEAHEPENHLIPLVLRAAVKNETLKVFGGDYPTCDGSCLRDFVHVEDLSEAHYLGLMHLMNGGSSECFNLGTSDGCTVLEIIRAAEEIVGKTIGYELAGRRPGDPAQLVASNVKAKEILGWTPKKSDIGTILRDAYNWELNRRY